jgi:hypothetical protein
MKTCFLLLTVVPCLAFHQAAAPPTSRRNNADLIARSASATIQDEKATTTVDLPPVLQDIVDERAEFQRNLGKAMDTLRKDYPYILHRAPDYSIYHDEIAVRDPSGLQLVGLSTYKKSIQFVQTLISFLYSRERNGLQFRIVYDFCRSEIRVSWHLELHNKLFPSQRPLHVDGISSYKMDVASGKVIEHKIENLLINNTPVQPPYGIFGMMREEMSPGVALGGTC